MRRAGGIIAVAAALLLSAGAALTTGPGAARAQPTPSRTVPVLITADEVNHDREKGLVIANGHVEVSQGPRVLKADRVIYDQNAKTVTAFGHVSLTEPTGEVVFAEKVKLREDLKEGVIENFRMLFPDNTKIAANSAVRTKGNRTQMNDVVFSPCKTCADRPPLWQLKARRVIHDQQAKDVTYYHAWLEVFGLPVAYTPYLSHPDPTVKRRTGLLAPTYGADSQLGYNIRAPYFIVLGPDKDITLTPRVFSKVRPSLAAQYRQRLKHGRFDVDGSITYVRRRDYNGNLTQGNQARGHIFTKGLFDLNQTWRAGWAGGWTSDDTYLRRYGIATPTTVFNTPPDKIISTGFAEGFRGRNYASMRAYHFQGLRIEDDPDTTPIVAPLVDVNMLGKPIGHLGRWSFDANALALTRMQGVDSRRLSFKTGWELPYTTATGHVFRAGAMLQSDLYWVNAVPNPDLPGRNFSGVTGRAFPQVYADWRFPLVRELGNVRHVIEPRAMVVGAPNFGNSYKIPNEDSRDLELDDTNIFNLNRFNAIDRVERGSRIVYGVTNAFYGNRGGRTELFLGNSYRFTPQTDFPVDSGVDSQLSDVVGRILVQPANYLTLQYRFRLSTKELRVVRHEASLAAGPQWLRLSLNYFFFKGIENNAEFGNREELVASLNAKLTDKWSIGGRTRYSFRPYNEPLLWGFGATYKNECCTVNLDFERTFTVDRDVRATNRFLLRIVLKHLGEVSQSY
jgi:LPS-assembly protein